MIFTNFKNLKILLDRYLIRLTFIISKEFEDSVGKTPYPSCIYYFEEFEDIFGKISNRNDICYFLRN